MKRLPLWVEREGGLSFACTRCGACCTGEPGYVWVAAAEIRALAARVGLAPDEFGRRYLRRVGDRISLLEKRNGDCVFWEPGRGCTVYEARPAQCRTYPFWPETIRTRAAWRAERGRCPGIEAVGAREYRAAEVLRLVSGAGET